MVYLGKWTHDRTSYGVSSITSWWHFVTKDGMNADVCPLTPATEEAYSTVAENASRRGPNSKPPVTIP
jgi:hypothetical protein